MLNIIEKYVQLKGYKYVRMDGATPIGLRQPLVKKFNQVLPLKVSNFIDELILNL